MMKIKNKKIYFLIYSLLFTFYAGIIFYFAYSQGKSLITSGDNFRQFYRATVYYSNYLKELFTNIFVNHNFVIPTYSFVLGEGSDILTTLNYYVIGDPFSFFSFLVNEDSMYIFYDVMTILRLYIAGITFSCLCIYKKKDYLATLVGALSYAFCYYGLMQMFDFPFMLNPMVFEPLVILGIEKIIDNNKPITLIVSVFLSAISNVYFFYIIILVTIIYALVRAIFINLKLKQILIIVLKIVIYSLIGVCMAGIIFLPSLDSILNYSRLSIDHHIGLFWSNATYKAYFTSFILGSCVNGCVSFGGFSLLSLFSIVSMFINKKKDLITLFFVGLVMLVFPCFSQMFNGFSYPQLRWIWSISLLICYITVDCFDHLTKLDSKTYMYITTTIGYFVACALLDYVGRKIYIVFALLGITVILFIKIIKNESLRKLIIVSAGLLSIFINILNLTYPGLWNYTKNGLDFNELKSEANLENKAVDLIEDESFWRYSSDELVTNESILGNHSATNYYWSVANDNVEKFREELGLSDHSNLHYDDYNERSSLMSLAGVKYFISKNNISVNNFTEIATYDDYKVLLNNNPLSLVYAYDKQINFVDWSTLPIIAKQETLTQNVVVEDKPTSDGKISYENKRIDYTYEEENLEYSDNKIIVSNGYGNLKINFDYQGVGEYYIVFDNLHWESDRKISWYDHQSTDIIINNGEINNTIYYKSVEHSRYSNRHDFAINVGNINDKKGTINIYFENTGIYTFDSFELIYLPLSKQNENISKLNDININNLEISTNKVSTNIQIDQNKIICFAIPYAKGWSAYVDGKKTDLFKANVMYMGIEVESGPHEIELLYENSALKYGMIITLIGFASFAIVMVKQKKRI